MTRVDKRGGFHFYSSNKKKRRNCLFFFSKSERLLVMMIIIRKWSPKSICRISYFIKPTVEQRTCFIDNIWKAIFIRYCLFDILFEISKKWKPYSHSSFIPLEISSIICQTKWWNMQILLSGIINLTYDNK
jgi:hypothetical protein